MSFSVTIVGLPDEMTLDEAGILIREYNERWERVNDTEWPVNEQLARHWHVSNNGTPEAIQSNTGLPVMVLTTNPFIQRKKNRSGWYDRHAVLRPFEERINVFGRISFFFEHDRRVWCAIMASSKSDHAGHVVSDLLETCAEVDRHPAAYAVPSDMVYWVLRVHRELGQNLVVTQDGRRVPLRIADVRGYRGSTQGGHSMRGKGAHISGHMTTQAMVAERERFTAVELEVIMGTDRICCTLMDDGSCYVDEQNTRCQFARVPNAFDRAILTTVFIYRHVLPLLHSAYQAEIRAETWSDEQRETFIRRVALELSNSARDRAMR